MYCSGIDGNQAGGRAACLSYKLRLNSSASVIPTVRGIRGRVYGSLTEFGMTCNSVQAHCVSVGTRPGRGTIVWRGLVHRWRATVRGTSPLPAPAPSGVARARAPDETASQGGSWREPRRLQPQQKTNPPMALSGEQVRGETAAVRSPQRREKFRRLGERASGSKAGIAAVAERQPRESVI